MLDLLTVIAHLYLIETNLFKEALHRPLVEKEQVWLVEWFVLPVATRHLDE